VFRSRAERKVEEAGYDPNRLPPGQYLTEKWPVLHAGTVPQTDLSTWDFRIFGAVENPLTLSWNEFTALPSREITTDIHCVTRWSRFDASFKGVHWSELAKLVQPKPSARFVVGHAEQDFTVNVPLSALEEPDALLAYEADGEPLTPEHGWPLRLVIPKRYFWKSAKWLRGITGRGSVTGSDTKRAPGGALFVLDQPGASRLRGRRPRRLACGSPAPA
jgi:DMSO/TMAO reductase YedYZ molybdopterin-dependent catalytic subunit